MPTILSAPDRLTAAQKKATTTLFLAGPFEDTGTGWRDDVIAAYADLDITIIDPRNERWAGLEAGSPGRRGAYDWQCAAAFDADVVIVWVPAEAQAPTALMTLGYLAAKRGNAKRSSSVIVGGDGGDGLVQLFAQNQQLFPAGNDLDEVVRIARLALEQAIASR
ncbi:MAG: nucleoside 2-deoxyribosyltransferase domain-containing protein [Propionibacteriales bacterium]|nr:nucleoside 2-deoxyribosyltransferase domain-containing protein [Propionibacteriales bacterium]